LFWSAGILPAFSKTPTATGIRLRERFASAKAGKMPALRFCAIFSAPVIGRKIPGNPRLSECATGHTAA
jgi:hypothetical protein